MSNINNTMVTRRYGTNTEKGASFKPAAENALNLSLDRDRREVQGSGVKIFDERNRDVTDQNSQVRKALNNIFESDFDETTTFRYVTEGHKNLDPGFVFDIKDSKGKITGKQLFIPMPINQGSV